MVAFDGDCLLAFGATRFNDVWINGALRQEACALVTPGTCFQFGGFVFEYIDKQSSNDFAFLFWLADAGQFAQKQIAGIHTDHTCVQFAFEHFHDHVAFVQAQQAVINKHTSELIANGAVNQSGSNG